MKQIQIIGNIGRDAQKYSGNGREFLSFTVAVNEKWKDAQGQKQERTDWFSVITTQMNLQPYLTRGTQVFVQGPLRASIYRNEKTGTNAIDMTINADGIKLLGSPQDSTAPAPQAAATSEADSSGLPWDR